MLKTNFYLRDLQAEVILGEFLSSFYYPRLGLEKYERCKELDGQYKGIDVKVNRNSQEIFIDEKGLLSIPKPVGTFALELSYFKEGELKVGWLFDDKKLTTHYLLCWVKRKDCELEELKVEDIHYVEAILVDRALLHAYLEEEYSINNESSWEVVETVIKKGVGGRLDNLSDGSLSRYHYSNQLKERPVNIVMTKADFLKSNSVESHHIITRRNIREAE